MCASPLSLLRAGPPPPKVALLPDALFFTRAVPVTAGATASEGAAQIELALEGISPFPLAQLYYGWFWAPGAELAFVFAAYRRRFTTEQTAAWGDAEVVLPAFAALLGAEVGPATTVVLHSVEGLTAVHWEQSPVPARVLVRPLAPDATDEQRAQARDELIRAIGESRKVVDLESPITAEPAKSDGEVAFRSGDFVSRFAAPRTAALDVRDKGDLAALRGARKRDLLLWRVAFGCAAALLLLAVGEFALFGGGKWNGLRKKKVDRDQPAVVKIMSAQELATRIEDLATKRLLPFEMMNVLIEDNRMPPEIQFTRVITLPQAGIYSLTINAKFINGAGQVSLFEAKLRSLPMIQKVEVRDLQTRGDSGTFTLIVTFKPDTLKPADSIAQ